MKQFKEEIYKLFDRLKSGQPFAFSKFADGEWAAIQNETLDNREFQNDINTSQFYRDKLIESICFVHPDYYVGVCCSCCNGDRARKMKVFCGQPEDQITFANVFVNANYSIYKETFLKEYAKWDIHLVAHKTSKIDQLPFKIEKFYPIERNAWVNNYSLIEEIKAKKLENKLFLFCTGPFGNLLAHQLFNHNRHNTYLDVGSTLNPWLQSEGFTRDYYVGGSQFSNRECRWE
jgi:hypothetical protein